MTALHEVISGGLNLRTAPETGEIIVTLGKGELVEKLEDASTKGWWKVRASIHKGTADGYIASRFVRSREPKAPFTLPFFPNLGQAFQQVVEFVGDYAKDMGQDKLPEMNKVLSQYGINANRKRLTHFMAQIAHESGNFRLLRENLNYSADGLRKIFSNYFKTDEEAQAYARQPEKIACYVYANRMGNGDVASGDGWTFRGRGYLQITGRSNYEMIGKKLGVDLLADPDLLARDPVIALKAACVYWDEKKINRLADADDIQRVTKAVNGGLNGLKDRIELLERAQKIWK